MDHPENEKSEPDFVPESDDDSSEDEIREEEFRGAVAVVAVRETESTQEVDATEEAERVRNVRGSKMSKNRKHSLIDSHPMLPSCACKRKCVDSIDDLRRKSIHQEYWSMSKELRDEFLFQRVNERPKERKGKKKNKRSHGKADEKSNENLYHEDRIWRCSSSL